MIEPGAKIIEKSDALKQLVREFLPEPGLKKTAIDGFSMSLRIHPTSMEKCFYKPMAIIVLQGQKHTILGTQDFIYNENQCIVTSIDIPTAGHIVKASPEKPFMTMILELDSYLIAQLIAETKDLKGEACARRGMAVADADAELLDAFLRLAELLKQPEKQAVLAPMIIREIYYLLLTGPLSDHIRLVNTKGTRNHQIAKAISWLKDHFKEALKVEELAEKVNMAPSSFYRNFSKVTSLSPLQYQKQLRLHEAQRLMLAEGRDAANAAYAVGYESPTQFNREYKKLFGAAPRTNIKELQAVQKML